MCLIYDGSAEFNDNPRSHVYKMGDYCIKYYRRTQNDCITESKNLNLLESYRFAPKLYYTSEANDYIIMEFIIGTPLGNIKKCSSSYKRQLTNIKNTLDRLNIHYEKEKIHCIVEPSGTLRFIDFNI